MSSDNLNTGEGMLGGESFGTILLYYAIRRRAREDILTFCYRKKQIDVSFSYVCPVIENEFRHNIVNLLGYRLVDPQLL